jgi:ankyrin repeat protein
LHPESPSFYQIHPEGETLAQAVFQGRLEVAKLLLEKGANPDARGKDGRSVLELASKPPKPNSPDLEALIRHFQK